MEDLRLKVIDIHIETPAIRRFLLARPDGGALPGWRAGAHIEVQLLSGGTRMYSLVNTSAGLDTTQPQTAYCLGVRLEEKGMGGSAFMHSLQVGDSITVSAPKNRFALEPDTEEVVLLAGGIGITPIVSMAAELAVQGRPYRLVYAGRSKTQLAFLEEVERLCGDRLRLHGDDLNGTFDLRELMQSLATQTLYLCGPLPMIDAAVSLAKELNWLPDRLQFEIFTAPQVSQGNRSFDVVLEKSGKVVHVAADQTILQALEAAGEMPMADCRRGDCGICQTAVTQGLPDHRDYYLSEKERASNSLIQICVSRAYTASLHLDL